MLEDADLGHHCRQRRAGDECHVDGAGLQCLEHLHLAAQSGVWKLLDAETTGRSLRDLGGKHGGAGAQLGFRCKNVAEFELLGLLGGGDPGRTQSGRGRGHDGRNSRRFILSFLRITLLIPAIPIEPSLKCDLISFSVAIRAKARAGVRRRYAISRLKRFS